MAIHFLKRCHRRRTESTDKFILLVRHSTFGMNLCLMFCACLTCRSGMARRVSLSAFVVNIVLLRYSYNASFFPFSAADMDDNSFTRLMYFALIMFVVEWIITAIVHIMIYKLYGIDS